MKRTLTRAAPSGRSLSEPGNQRSGLGLSIRRVRPGSSPPGLFPEGTGQIAFSF